MTDTAPNQDSEIDAILENLVVHTANEYGGFEGFDDDDSRDGIDEAKAKLLALKQRWSTEARIDELQAFPGRLPYALVGGPFITVDKRIAELKATLQPGEKGE